jgi:FAD binding domain/Berberine and berberine like
MISFHRRKWLKRAGAIPLLPAWLSSLMTSPARAAASGGRDVFRRCRPSDPSWPSASSWERLGRAVGGRLIKVQSPLAECGAAPESAPCAQLFKALKNPYYIGDQVALTQTSGWVDAWVSSPSVYAVAAASTQDVVAAVNFARRNKLRLVVKGGGHSYQGTSNASDSLLVWTRAMNDISLHDAFVGAGCAGKQDGRPAVTIGAGAIWMHVYDTVTTKGGRYVQGGGCATVGVAGLVQSGGFGSFSKNYGMAAAALLEAEVVTADGDVRIANACTNPELFWGIKGGGGGSLGIVTRVTLQTRELPDFFGGVFGTIKAGSDAAYRRLIARFVGFYGESLFNRYWGEQAGFNANNTLRLGMVFQGLSQQQATEVWRPFLDWLAASPQDFTIASGPIIVSIPARHFWDPEYLRKIPGLVTADDRPGAPGDNVFWAGNLGEAGQVLHGYQSAWLSALLLRPEQQERLCVALFESSRHWPMSLHFNKGLAGAPAEALAAAKDTAMNRAVLDAFALAITAGEGPPAFPGIRAHEPDLSEARQAAAGIGKALGALLPLVPRPASYVSESNYFQSDWQQSFWGDNYVRLQAVKKKYDPDGLFFVHHGVGSEAWSADGFTKSPG